MDNLANVLIALALLANTRCAFDTPYRRTGILVIALICAVAALGLHLRALLI